MMFLVSGCGVVAEGDVSGLEADDVLKDEPLGVSEMEVDHGALMNPLPLAEEEKELSLEGYGANGALIDEEVSVADMLMYAVQDEYLARNEYQSIMDIYGESNPYANIKRSEETHLSYLREVYDAYGLVFPDDVSAEHLIVPESLLEAAQTGVQAEILNIAMYEKFLQNELPENVKDVFTALMLGSESHLLAFEKQVERYQ